MGKKTVMDNMQMLSATTCENKPKISARSRSVSKGLLGRPAVVIRAAVKHRDSQSLKWPLFKVLSINFFSLPVNFLQTNSSHLSSPKVSGTTMN